MQEPIIACTLNASDQAKRLDRTAELSQRALLGAEKISGGLRLRFSTGPGIRDELEHLIEAESECCSFLDFHLRSHQGDLVLEVTGPEQAQPLIQDLFGSEAPTVLGQ
jgi:hypothetical protein